MTRVGLLAAVLLSIGGGGQPVIATQAAEPTAPMTVKVGPRSGSGAFPDTALVYLDGRIDAGAPDRLSKALRGLTGKVAIWLNSPGGNLFAGMQLGRIIREHGASTHIINSGTLLPGECYSACALAFLGGVYRFNDNGARYGVHRASLPVDRATGERDLGQDLGAAIGSYMREMGIDARLLDLWAKAAPDEMYVLSQKEAKDLRVVNDGREPPEWSIAPFPGGTMLQGRQATADGRGTVFFSCDEKQTIFGSVYEAAGTGEPAAVRRWRHVVTIDSYDGVPVKPLGVSSRDGAVRSTFLVPPDLVRLAMSAKRIGHLMKPSSHTPSIGVSVDVDESSALMVRTFLGGCLRRQAKK
jgi:hypothetical protein